MDARPTRSSGLTFVGLILGAVVAALSLGQLGQLADPSQRPPAVVAPDVATTTARPDLPATPEPDKPISLETIRRCPAQLGGLQLGGLTLSDHRRVNGWSHVRWDCRALNGPWSVVVRAADGRFGVHGAVVTFPVEPGGTGTAATKPRGAVWRPGAQQLVWPLAGAHAQIVGDIGQTQLEDLATRITVEAGKPRLSAPDGYSARYVLLATTTYRPPVVHEMHYRTRDLGQESRLGDGLVYTGLMSGAALESQAFAARATPAGLVRGRPAIYSGGQGGERTLAWEPAPGEVAYIGVRGAATETGAMAEADAIEYLRALADQGRPLSPAQWEAKDRVAVGSR